MTAATHTRAAAIAADVDQLVNPIHVAIQGRVVTHPCLLDQLRDACTPSSNPGSGIRTPPVSRPPLRLEAVHMLSEIYVGISTWHGRLNLPSPPRHHDWQKAVLQAFTDTAPNLAPAIADYLGDEIHEWWRTAAHGTGWQPNQLRKLR